MRQPPQADPPSLDNRQVNDIIQIRHYELLTPLFGGGVNPGEADEKFPIRGSTVRGQLRFWWRATRGGGFHGNRAAMKAAEDRIWGSTTGGSRVSVAITAAKHGNVFNSVNSHGEPTDIGNIHSVDSYAAFPLRETKGRSAGEAREKVTFSLRLSFPADVAEDVRAALWAWDTFGGVGGRTRRGFGALHCLKVDPPDDGWRWEYVVDGLNKQLEADVARFVSDQPFPADVPHLSRDPNRYRVARQGAGRDPIVTWRALITSLRKFRQSRPPGSPRPGRSHWPEPDAIRRITRQPKPLPTERRAYYAFNKFPRAAFGLPIIFEFKNEREATFYEPRKTTLDGQYHSRLASPLILRPLALAGGTYIGLGVILDGPGPDDLPGGLVLRDKETRAVISPVDSELTPPEAAAMTAPGRHPVYNGNTDILQAFLDQL